MIRRLLSALGLGGGGGDGDGAEQNESDGQPAAGDLCSFASESGGFGLLKILAVDELGVHVRLYTRRFTARPTRGEIGTPDAPSGSTEGRDKISIGHVPLRHSTYAGWQPEPVVRGRPVRDNELDGYHTWQEANGGYF